MENFSPTEVLRQKSGNDPSGALKLKPVASSLFSIDLRYIESIPIQHDIEYVGDIRND